MSARQHRRRRHRKPKIVRARFFDDVDQLDTVASECTCPRFLRRGARDVVIVVAVHRHTCARLRELKAGAP